MLGLTRPVSECGKGSSLSSSFARLCSLGGTGIAEGTRQELRPAAGVGASEDDRMGCSWLA